MSYCREHPEAITAASSHAVWALIFVGANKRSFIVASCWAIELEVSELGHDPDDIGISPSVDEPGFYLWRGSCEFDGLDGVEYTEGSITPLDYPAALAQMALHEDSPPDRDAEDPTALLDELIHTGEGAA